MTLAKRLQNVEAEVARLAEQHEPVPEMTLREFVEMFWGIIEPGTPFVDSWWLGVLSEYLEAIEAGQITRLVVNVPPRSGKSTWCSVLWPAWCWSRNPSKRFLFTSYSAILAEGHSSDRRRVIESPKYRELWSKSVKLATDQNERHWFANDKRGVMIATSMGGSATGLGADVLVVDDAHSAKGAASDIERSKTVRDFRQTFSTRLNNKKTGAILLIGQRFHVEDLYGYALEWGYQHLFLPAEATAKSVLILPSGRPLERDNRVVTPSGRTIEREVGSLLWPEREGPEEIKSVKADLHHAYSGQYQQQPSPESGTKFQRDWFRYFVRNNGNIATFYVNGRAGAQIFDESELTWFSMMDPAVSTSVSACFSTIQVWCYSETGEMFLMHQFRKKVEAPDLVREATDIYRRFHLDWIGIEKDGVGLPIIQEVKLTGITVKAIKARGAKEARTASAEIRMECGQIFFPKDAPWLEDLENELLLFPNSAYKDQADTLAHSAIHVAKMAAPPLQRQENPTKPEPSRVSPQEQKEQEQEQQQNEARERFQREAEDDRLWEECGTIYY